MFKGVGRQLEYDKLLYETSRLAKSSVGRDRVLSLQPSVNYQEVSRNLELTDSFVKLLKERALPLETFPDVSPLIEKLKVEGSVLSVEELLNLLKLLEQSRVLKNFFKNLPEHLSRISFYSERLTGGGELLERLRESVDESGEILDTASPQLRSIRKNISTVSSRIKEKLSSLVNRHEDICPDRIITEREGRYVILVKPHFRKRFRAIVHDRSSSGQTLYVEPLSVVELNNRLRELKREEAEEVRRVLRELSNLARSYLSEIESSFKALVEIDFRYAVAYMSLKLSGTLPTFGREFSLKGAKHPLLILSGKEVVPVDLKLKKGLVITGPNTGGKTVSLKTLGLLSMMAQSGFLIPAQEGSSLLFVRKWFSDIGDEQSIEQSLSTFSSHVKRIGEILREVDEDSLVLLDELGAGTDPVEGSALAVAILKYLRDKKAKVVATTHFTPVKLYAYKDDYYDVASVLFDEESLKPLYKLAYGVVGKSYALIVAKRYGIPEEVIETARSLMGAEDRMAEEIIEALEREYRKLVEERREVERLKRELSKREEELREKERKLREEHSRKLDEFIEELRKKTEEILRERETSKAKERFRKLVISAKNRAKLEEEVKPRGEVKVGDTVKVLPSGRKGKVLEITGKKAKVLIGPMKVDVKLSNLVKVEEVPKEEGTPVSAPRPSRFFPELKLLGMRGDEALRALEEFLDDALIVGAKEVKVVHGYGEGILKRLVREYLKESPYVKSFRPGGPQEGGDGVTIVELK
ncbi:MAG: endonuclease MutS2 [Desulfurobacteriaceae bacterium]